MSIDMQDSETAVALAVAHQLADGSAVLPEHGHAAPEGRWQVGVELPQPVAVHAAREGLSRRH